MAYKAGMGASTKAGPGPISEPEREIAEWLRSGGLVVAASERAARALIARYHRARRSEGLAAWPAPTSSTGNRFSATRGKTAQILSRLPTACFSIHFKSNPSGQRLRGSEQHMATLLEGPLNRLASLAMEAHKLLCFYAPKFLHPDARTGWQQDAGNFSAWLTAFDRHLPRRQCSQSRSSAARVDPIA